MSGFEFERDRAYSRLVELIFGGSLTPQTPLSERKLADALGMGRMPVREALRQLESEGVVAVKPARGTFVRHLTSSDLADVYAVRAALEDTAAALAARNGPSAALSTCIARMRVMARDPSAFTPREIDDVGTDFHNGLLSSADNYALSEMVRVMRLRFRLAFHLPRYFAHSLVHSILHEHIEIAAAIEARDEDAARNLMREHLARGLAMRLEFEDSRRSGTQADDETDTLEGMEKK
ncbi:GntR family transcriptional regulator [Acuticoccus sp. I52.16.1]|uniref:GntR family transcriptional regulator n=1 Tax=Acuticoccus sp. I52.16.1 TaxID=2928472 RepID=UPI001FD2BE91|nr:GntR family transcriptional regulator [Acuticoccus sp. I52.16.1]UOM37156.1 GntR family transcriptional regulator [Acuticoccus sp. I52.16.1]